jgi:hypothetical protein
MYTYVCVVCVHVCVYIYTHTCLIFSCVAWILLSRVFIHKYVLIPGSCRAGGGNVTTRGRLCKGIISSFIACIYIYIYIYNFRCVCVCVCLVKTTIAECDPEW